MIDDSIAHKLLNRSPAFLLRDKIRLFDRFAVSTETVSPALTSRCARDDQLPDNVMFPGWKEVPKPPLPAIPLLAAPLKTDKHFWKPTSRKPVSVDISTSQNINKYHDHAQSSMIVSVPIVADPLWSPRPDLSNSNLEAIEDDLKTIMETAIMANTHVLTSKFQDVLKTQYNQVEHHHRVLADHYKARVTKAMIAAQTKLNRCREELRSSNLRIQFLEKVVFERDSLRKENEELRTQVRRITKTFEEEKNDLVEKVKFLRNLAASTTRPRAPSCSPEHKRNSIFPASPLQPITVQQPEPVKEDVKPLVDRQLYSPVDSLQDNTAADDTIKNLILELEEKQEQIADLTKAQSLIEKRSRALAEENNRLKHDLSQEVIKYENDREKLMSSSAKAVTDVKDLTAQLDIAKGRIESLNINEFRTSTLLKKAMMDLKTERSANENMERDMKQMVQQLTDSLLRTRRTMCIRSLLFQAHVTQMRRSIGICDKIDEYLNAQLTCKECFNTMKKPQVLYPCGHSVCEGCVDALRDNETGRLVCNDCNGICESITVTNSVVDAIISQYNWWKVSLGDMRKKILGAEDALSGSAMGDIKFAHALSEQANEANPMLRQSLARLNVNSSRNRN